MTMNKNFKEQQNVPAPPVTLDDINKANLDLNFLAALVKNAFSD
jgi:hypothetical protein